MSTAPPCDEPSQIPHSTLLAATATVDPNRAGQTTNPTSLPAAATTITPCLFAKRTAFQRPKLGSSSHADRDHLGRQLHLGAVGPGGLDDGLREPPWVEVNNRAVHAERHEVRARALPR